MAIGGGFEGPATRVDAVTPDDNTDLTGVRGIYVGAGGNVAVRCIHSPSVTATFVGVPAGTILPVQVTRVMAASTATSILALY